VDIIKVEKGVGGKTLSFRPIPVEKKIEEKIQPIAREAGVDRSSVYFWKDRALISLKEALEPHKRGPKFKKDPRSRKDSIPTFL